MMTHVHHLPAVVRDHQCASSWVASAVSDFHSRHSWSPVEVKDCHVEESAGWLAVQAGFHLTSNTHKQDWNAQPFFCFAPHYWQVVTFEAYKYSSEGLWRYVLQATLLHCWQKLILALVILVGIFKCPWAHRAPRCFHLVHPAAQHLEATSCLGGIPHMTRSYDINSICKCVICADVSAIDTDTLSQKG